MPNTNGVRFPILVQFIKGASNQNSCIFQVHERSVQSDFLLIILKRILEARRDFRIILMSATVDSEKFSSYFQHCPVLNIPGRTFPVEVGFICTLLSILANICCTKQVNRMISKGNLKARNLWKVFCNYWAFEEILERTHQNIPKKRQLISKPSLLRNIWRYFDWVIFLIKGASVFIQHVLESLKLFNTKLRATFSMG